MSLDLEAIEEREKAATPGPWLNLSPCNRCDTIELDAECNGRYATREDLDFAQAAREDVPALIAEVRRLRALQKYPEAIICPAGGLLRPESIDMAGVGAVIYVPSEEPKLRDLKDLLGRVNIELTETGLGASPRFQQLLADVRAAWLELVK